MYNKRKHQLQTTDGTLLYMISVKANRNWTSSVGTRTRSSLLSLRDNLERKLYPGDGCVFWVLLGLFRQVVEPSHLFCFGHSNVQRVAGWKRVRCPAIATAYKTMIRMLNCMKVLIKSSAPCCFITPIFYNNIESFAWLVSSFTLWNVQLHCWYIVWMEDVWTSKRRGKCVFVKEGHHKGLARVRCRKEHTVCRFNSIIMWWRLDRSPIQSPRNIRDEGHIYLVTVRIFVTPSLNYVHMPSL